MFCFSKIKGKGCWMQEQERENKDPAKHILQTQLLWGFRTFSSPKLLGCQAGLSRGVVQSSPALWESWELCGKAEIPCQQMLTTAIPAGNVALLQCWPEGTAVLSQLPQLGETQRWEKYSHKRPSFPAPLPETRGKLCLGFHPFQRSPGGSVPVSLGSAHTPPTLPAST